jgi:Ca2+ transporting ATPase
VLLSNGGQAALTSALRNRILHKIEHEYNTGHKALRCLALATKDGVRMDDPNMKTPEAFAQVESNMTFIGVVGIQDPPREEVKEAIERCNHAGIRVVVITGDNPHTAEAVCRQIGVFSVDQDVTGRAFTGREFEQMSPEKQSDAVRQAHLFSRTEPAHKKLLVELLQKQHEVVAMTGDGVNDAPALKAADIGIAMGTGTSVAKEASRMVLADDNFTTIVNAVEEGRAIYNNTKAFIRYLISSNIGEVVCIFLAAAMGIPEVLVPITLLWVNLVTDGLPATALSFNPPEADVMNKPPRRKQEDLVDRLGIVRYMVIGCYVGIATVLGYVWWQLFYEGGPQLSYQQLTSWDKCGAGGKSYPMANGFDCTKPSLNPFTDSRPMTVSLSVLVTIEMFNALNALAENESLLTTPPWVNPWLVGAISLSFLQHFAILYTPLKEIFLVSSLNASEWQFVIAVSFPIILIDEVLKVVSRHQSNRTVKS